MNYTFTAFAKNDLDDITEYTFQKFGYEQSLRYVANLESCAEDLADGFGSIKEMQYIVPKLYAKHCQHHYIFGLKSINKPMAIIAILHERMDLIKRIKARI